MSKNRSSRLSKTKTDWDEFESLTEDEVRAGIESAQEAHPTVEDFCKNAQVVMPQPKETMTIRLYADVLEWFRKQGIGYETRINAILRSYMRAHQPEEH
jgi:uncharacterized protein (DUF4415 family)